MAAQLGGGMAGYQKDKKDWTFFTNHGHVLVCLARDPHVRLRDVAELVGITERAVQRIVSDLHEGGYIEIEKEGRRNHYNILGDQHFRHPIEDHCSVDMILGRIVGEAPDLLERVDAAS